jgi:hypothetical protein
MTALIQGQSLINSFLKFIPAKGMKSTSTHQEVSTGPINKASVPMALQMKLPEIFSPLCATSKYKDLFNGVMTDYGDDHSAADMALIGYLERQKLSEHEADTILRSSSLYRDKWDRSLGESTYGQVTIRKVFSNRTSGEPIAPIPQDRLPSIDECRPIYHPNGMPARTFVGPKIIEGTRLFPINALSLFVALGGVGKTSVLLSMATHIAAGKTWNGHPLQQKKVAMYFCEESREEIDRKFSAIVDDWTNLERKQAEDNLLTVCLLGRDARLTRINGKHYGGTGVSEEIINQLSSFGLQNGLVILDHTQGFSAGDLNISETATSIALEANKIVSATGSAVVLSAHISKNNIQATSIDQGFAVGSLAVENAARQMSGMIPMPDEVAKKFNIDGFNKDYVLLGVAKNSYGAISEGLWLKKEYSHKFHTVTFRPIKLQIPLPAKRLNDNEKLANRIINAIQNNPYMTRNKLDSMSGINEPLKASKGKVRDALNILIESGEVKHCEVTEEERRRFNLPKQIKVALRCLEAKTADNEPC